MRRGHNFRVGQTVISEIYGEGTVLETFEEHTIIQWKYLGPMKIHRRDYEPIKVKRFFEPTQTINDLKPKQ